VACIKNRVRADKVPLNEIDGSIVQNGKFKNCYLGSAKGIGDIHPDFVEGCG